MPRRALRVCLVPGCPNLVTKGRCEGHEREYQQRRQQVRQDNKSEDDRARHALYDRSWQSRRALQLAHEPWCADCLRREIWTPATDVHHIIRHEGSKELFRKSPLLSLCQKCHSRRTWGETRGEVDAYFPQVLPPFPIPIYVVCGPPASGKTTFVKSKATSVDIVIDLDVIISQITGRTNYHVEDRKTIDEAIRSRNQQLQGLKTFENKCQKAWLIVSAPTRSERRVWLELLHPVTVYLLATPVEECVRRIKTDPRRVWVVEDQVKAVNRWWKKYEQLPGDEILKS